eukprot:m.117649 g.117649  ORF g.117649 m.117649 type:complete len:264 (-) comp15548_c0_seq3:2866-3657(-)
MTANPVQALLPGHLKPSLAGLPNYIPNVLDFDPETKTFTLAFTEKGTAYGESEPSEQHVTLCIQLDGASLPGEFIFQDEGVTQWGLNFAGTVTYKQSDSMAYIYIPGTRTYDPAGLSGDPHASERIGDSCTLTQTIITTVQLIALKNGATEAQLSKIQERFSSTIERYHGRLVLFDYMFQQVLNVFHVAHGQSHHPEQSYADFTHQAVESGRIDLQADASAHTVQYLDSVRSGQAGPPKAYYEKQASKEPDSLDLAAVLASFQ